ncbi:formylglycine-generating enzyme family protein [Azospirillum picis]|uniref:Formylglycine-generating enzyme required for sulfatase activity n=1 Tax=Azospirillum picis TaxID=488438 RepID=A0ABU0MT23_9PROT|nr:formylglycine-generating enzyme family protein [Azospirillum picis]MBP2302850.1 formylglycine-generating enzyme required for sulfatase activity [Azospirillum picis]MDQ0536645.1 formylglycine-generating enzyme required for sulfatase activity [Azospirillum picis]
MNPARPRSLGVLIALVILLAGVAAWRRIEPVDLSGWRAERLATFKSWQTLPVSADGPPALEIWDHPDAPVLVVVPAGQFVRGSPPTEEGHFPEESPQRTVSIPRPLAIGRYPVTRAEYGRFIEDSGYQPKTRCYGYAGETELKKRWHFSWHDPGFGQTDRDPAVCIGWYDAKAYAAWLSSRTGERYRLPTEAEWEYAARAGTSSARWWGERASDGCDAANVADLTAKDRFTDWQVAPCRDGALFTAPVGSYRPNAFGLYDMLGNVWQWVEDCAADGYGDAPADGSPNLAGNCRRRMMRGGSWHSNPRYARSASRRAEDAEIGYAAYGIRVVRELAPTGPSPGGSSGRSAALEPGSRPAHPAR